MNKSAVGIRLMACIAMMPAFAGCASDGPPAASSAHVDVAPPASAPVQPRLGLDRHIVSNDGTIRVAYAFESSPPPLNEPFAMELRVESMDGAALGAVAVIADAGMPEHGHGMNVEPTVTQLGKDVFRVENMLFHMSGRWEIYFDVTREGVTSRAQDEITLE